VSLEELNAMTIVGTIRGIKYSEMQTQMRGMFVKLLKPTQEMGNLFRTLGVTSGEAAIGAYGLAGFMELLAARTRGDSAQIASYVNRIRGMQVAMLMSGKAAAAYRVALDKLFAAEATYGERI